MNNYILNLISKYIQLGYYAKKVGTVVDVSSSTLFTHKISDACQLKKVIQKRSKFHHLKKTLS